MVYTRMAIVEEDVALKVLKSNFIYSVPKLEQMKDLDLEIAFIGRSNVGKSSLINAVCQKKDLARTSKMPGRTRHAVVYELELAEEKESRSFTLVDLPGFGYASMSKTEAQECEALIFSYLSLREPLRQVFLLLDIRRDPDDREKQIVEIAKKRGLDLFFILTKSDKIPVSQRKPVMKKLVDKMQLNNDNVMLHSTFDQSSKEALQEKIYKQSWSRG